MDYKKIAPIISEKLTKEEAVDFLPIKKEEKEIITETKLNKETIIAALEYVKYLGSEQIPIEDYYLITSGPSEIVKKLNEEGFTITKEQVKSLCKELRSINTMIEIEKNVKEEIVEPIKEPIKEPIMDPIDVEIVEKDWEKLN